MSKRRKACECEMTIEYRQALPNVIPRPDTFGHVFFMRMLYLNGCGTCIGLAGPPLHSRFVTCHPITSATPVPATLSIPGQRTFAVISLFLQAVFHPNRPLQTPSPPISYTARITSSRFFSWHTQTVFRERNTPPRVPPGMDVCSTASFRLTKRCIPPHSYTQV